ncbi:MAG: tripartite tricarboxylate transporter TctB family protein [Candidatus Rokubacteria bacterium]|nr:tripartite tricarboxylate transporter TctB family protein [Candidatus Rokubacteria bacterium]
MRFSGRVLFSLALIAIAAYAIVSARQWPLKASLFPLVTGIPLLVLATAQLIADLLGKAESAKGPALDLEFSAEVPPDVARHRTAAIFAWIAGFILLVLLLGFPLAVPVFVFAYLALQGGADWWLTLTLTAVAWGFFHGLFERLLHLPFEAGWVQTWLGL